MATTQRETLAQPPTEAAVADSTLVQALLDVIDHARAVVQVDDERKEIPISTRESLFTIMQIATQALREHTKEEAITDRDR
jgi:hypothetical protein